MTPIERSSIDFYQLIEDCASAWQAVGRSEASYPSDPNLCHIKQNALDTTKALKDAMSLVMSGPRQSALTYQPIGAATMTGKQT